MSKATVSRRRRRPTSAVVLLCVCAKARRTYRFSNQPSRPRSTRTGNAKSPTVSDIGCLLFSLIDEGIREDSQTRMNQTKLRRFIQHYNIKTKHQLTHKINTLDTFTQK
jgi:hypothetical protein